MALASVQTVPIFLAFYAGLKLRSVIDTPCFKDEFTECEICLNYVMRTMYIYINLQTLPTKVYSNSNLKLLLLLKSQLSYQQLVLV